MGTLFKLNKYIKVLKKGTEKVNTKRRRGFLWRRKNHTIIHIENRKKSFLKKREKRILLNSIEFSNKLNGRNRRESARVASNPNKL